MAESSKKSTHFSHKSERIPVNDIKPGDLLTFEYNGELFTVLAVSCSRSGDSSSFFSVITTKNTLMSCFKVNHLQQETISTIVSRINKLGDKFSKIASYKYVKNLFGIFIGKDRFRTFISINSKIGSLTRIQVVEEEEDK